MAEKVNVPKVFTHEWFEYMWDYYKYYFLVGILAIVLLIVTIVQVKTSIKYDANVNFVATVMLDTETSDNLGKICAQSCADLNENGRVDVSVNQLNFTEENRKNIELHSALLNKLMAIFSSNDELIFVVDEYMLNEVTSLKYTSDIFYKAEEWSSENEKFCTDYAVSLRDSSAMKKAGINSEDMYVLIARMDYENGFTSEEKNAIKIADFLIK